MKETTDDLLSQLGRWATEQRVSQAAAGRARTRSLLDQLASSATWAGVLLDLAETQATVELTMGLHRISGRLVGVAQDFAALEQPTGFPVLVRFSAVTTITGPSPLATRAQGGSRRPAVELGFCDALEALVAETAPIRILTGGAPVEGNAVGLGEDILTLRSPQEVRRFVHLPLDAVSACELR